MPIPSARRALHFGLCAATLISLLVLKLAPFLLVLSFIAFVALPKQRARLDWWLCVGALALSLLGFLRFLVVEAVPGIVQGGTRAAEAVAVSKLREILFAEDSARRLGLIDPDGDGVGSAARVDELSGRAGVRGRERLGSPLLERYPLSVETSAGEAVEIGGFLFMVCLPTPAGGFSAALSASVDEELAERRFLAYAWPAQADLGLSQAFFLDEHEHIEVAPSRPGLRLGLAHPPSCDDAVTPTGRKVWQTWRKKRPRESLPGERKP